MQQPTATAILGWQLAVDEELMAAPSNPGPGFGLPPADTGNRLLDWLNGVLTVLLHVERRVDPLYRPLFDRLLREPLSNATTAVINHRRTDDGMALAEEREQPDEAELVDAIIAAFTKQMEALWNAGHFERGGNTKTHGIVRASSSSATICPSTSATACSPSLAPIRRGVRFASPGPYITPDIDDVGFMSMSIKVMDVDGAKLLDDERHTQDMLCVSTPTFVARHPCQRPAPAMELQERLDLLLLPSTARTCSTRSCSSCGRGSRAARSRASTSAASPTCSARARP